MYTSAVSSSKFVTGLGQYMAKTFLPSTVTIKFDTDMRYKNDLFEFRLKHNKENSTVNCDFIESINPNKFIEMPEIYIRRHIDKQYQPLTHVNRYYNYNAINKSFKFEAHNIPFRFILMLKDFAPNIQVSIAPIYGQQFEDYVNYWIHKIPNNSDENYTRLLEDTRKLSYLMNYTKLTVSKAPQYNNEDCKYLDYAILKSSKDDLYKQIEARKWETGYFPSGPSQIFILKSGLYYSITHAGKFKDSYHMCGSSGGGIDFSYMESLPLYQLFNQFPHCTPGFGNYHDMPGHNTYSTSKEIDVVEFTIFKEMLKKEGATFSSL